MDNPNKKTILTERAPAKVNLALNIEGKRADGYHLMDMINHSCTLHDTLALIPGEAFSLTVDGVELRDPEKNLVTKAVRLFEKTFLRKADFRVELKKKIPSRAGLGGGSADAAAMMRLMNRYWNLGLGAREMEDLGLSLGADVPYCVSYGTCRVGGIGERIEKAKKPIRLPGHLILLKPEAGVSTPEAFRLADEREDLSHPDIDALWEVVLGGGKIPEDAEQLNSFLGPVSASVPQIRDGVFALKEEGARIASLSGSGSAVVGYFDDEKKRDQAFDRLSSRFGDSFITKAEIEI